MTVKRSKGFLDLVAWKKARELAVYIYSDFKECKDYSFKDQIQRASVSTMNNIAEGYAKRSDRSFVNFLLIAKGSLSEVESMIILVYDLGHISKKVRDERFILAEETARITSGLIKKLTTHHS
jgi:four helix bundle protein